MEPRLWLAAGCGVGVAAACGLRAFLPPLAVGLAARFGLLHLRPGLEWLAGDEVLIALGVAAALEVLADKVPIVDHLLDAAGVVVRPLAAGVAAYAVLDGWDAPWARLLALVLGAGALAVQGAKAKARLGSTALSLGHANPILSLGEDVLALGLVALAILVPLLALAGALGLAWLLARWLRRRRPRPAA